MEFFIRKKAESIANLERKNKGKKKKRSRGLVGSTGERQRGCAQTEAEIGRTEEDGKDAGKVKGGVLGLNCTGTATDGKEREKRVGQRKYRTQLKLVVFRLRPFLL